MPLHLIHREFGAKVRLDKFTRGMRGFSGGGEEGLEVVHEVFRGQNLGEQGTRELGFGLPGQAFRPAAGEAEGDGVLSSVKPDAFP